MKKIPLLAIVGPTASGKTELAVSMARACHGEVISADSMQIYQGMSIATAKPTAEEMREIPHHLVDFVSAQTAFSVADYVPLAHKAIAETAARGHLPVLAGGTGLYVSSLLDNLSFSEQKSDPALREELYSRAENEGNEALLNELASIDPETARKLHPNNLGRIIRALEIYRLTGVTMSEQVQRSRRTPSPYQACVIGLTFRNRELLYDRINRRVDLMLEAGLLDEVRAVWEQGIQKTAVQAIGCKELIPFFEGSVSLEEAIDLIKRETRRYAKRQLTWFSKLPDIHWIFRDECADVFKEAKNILEISGICGMIE